MPFDLAGTDYNESDNWVARYEGIAEVVELGIEVVDKPYSVVAVGARPTPITTPPVFDQLLSSELGRIALLNAGKRSRTAVRRQAKKLFSTFRGIPVLDHSLQAVAKLSKDSRMNPTPTIVEVAHGFMSTEAAASIGTAFIHLLDKVSPANSRIAWTAVALLPAVASFVTTASSFNSFSPSMSWNAALPLLYALISAVLAMLAVSPVGWLLSALTSSLMRLRVPAEYRQRGRNWEPLKGSCLFVISACLVGAGYGAAGAMRWVSTVQDTAAPVINFAMSHTEQGTRVHSFLAQLAKPALVSPTVAVAPPAETRREIQRYLIAHRYLHGQADGKPGPRTNAAITRYELHEHISLWTPLPELLAYMRGH
ncbi:peptidoglycan-binding domain-containing protein [Burkholderia pseudomallei]|uniref:peptidoglycan-binding domain-containing protein n=1 Tax=Burkholderia pseudomallei TaxID=28450 RepID=UPI0011AB32DC|nr:hypothetical protein [Burkholderia pseudomallei]